MVVTAEHHKTGAAMWKNIGEGAIEGAVVGSFGMLGRTLKAASEAYKVTSRTTLIKKLILPKDNFAGAARNFQITVSATIGIAKNINKTVNWGKSEFEKWKRNK